MSIKLIAIDIDGTLINDQLEITEKTKETLQKATAQGIKVVLCTGRGPQVLGSTRHQQLS